MLNVMTPPGRKSRCELRQYIARKKLELAVLNKLPFQFGMIAKRKQRLEAQIEEAMKQLKIVY